MRKNGKLSSDAPFGTLLGYAPGGVAIYSSNYSSLDPRHYPEDADFRSYVANEYMGHKWQCVEFARRFLFLNYGMVFTDVGMAWEIFSLRFLRAVGVDDEIAVLVDRDPELDVTLGILGVLSHVAVLRRLISTAALAVDGTGRLVPFRLRGSFHLVPSEGSRR